MEPLALPATSKIRDVSRSIWLMFMVFSIVWLYVYVYIYTFETSQ